MLFFSRVKPDHRKSQKTERMCKTQSNTLLHSQTDKLSTEKKKKFCLNTLFTYRIVLHYQFGQLEHVLMCRRTNHDKSDNALQNNSNSGSHADFNQQTMPSSKGHIVHTFTHLSNTFQGSYLISTDHTKGCCKANKT